ncbi:(Fe-S)-binding protein [Mesosutterella sp. AGMB02718]|uniref:(Fe-S)-binding protein n=1 Tax=Mesosutterella faecium TaxID=2925194 RepID=A0ABT7IPF0_9BURK|nr:(Fe-S)-binding protein [Mesosutterella sp. AGMB02718]MDL2059181.1 (Fe-S)-binding protein [Mesosutterella sp. AGMB02718]
MNPTPFRPTFWNIPVEGQILIYILGILAVLFCAWGTVKSVRAILSGKPKALKEDPRERLRRLWNECFLQTRIMRTASGKAHFAIFWGFIFLFFGTAAATLDWDVTRTLFGVRFLKGDFYLFYKLILDCAGVAALIGLGYAAYSRWIKKGPSLEASPRFAALIGSLAFIIITGFFIEALRLAAQKPEWAGWSPVGCLLAGLFSSLSAPSLTTAHALLWWIHGLSALVFIAAIPATFYSHIFKAPWNIFEQKLEPLGAVPNIEKIEEQESFGISKFDQMSWKNRLDFEACTECARCTAVCPAVKMETPLNPKEFVLKLQRAGRQKETQDLSGVISEQELWSCSTCGACLNACPSRIDIPDLVVQMRTHYALEEGKFPPGVAKTLQNVATVGNPWGLDPGSRLDWASGLDVPLLEEGRHVDVLYWVGCAASYDRRAQKIARAMVKILKAAGVSFGVMPEERCHADFARRLGEEYLFQTAAAENIENFKRYSFDRILCACPHCFNTLAHEYPQFDGGKFQVISHADFILELISKKLLPALSPDEVSTVYHDPCYLARYNGIAQSPRSALRTFVPDLREPENMGLSSLCCGAGGGQFWFDGSRTQRINVIRFDELKATKAARIATACPFCMSMLGTAKSQRKDEGTVIKDIAEIVAEALDKKSR